MIEALRMLAVRSFTSFAKPIVAPTRPTTPWTAVAMTAMVSPLLQQHVSPLSPRSPFKKLGGDKSMTFMKTMFKAYFKAKKAGESKKYKKHDYDSSSSSDSE
jgi:hypothetical protein